MQRLLPFVRILFVAVVVLQLGEADAGVILSTPAGLAAGEKFRVLFVTQGAIDAASPSIDTYNNFVQTQAGGATYNGQVVNWRAIGTTSTVFARDNAGGFGTSVGVYLVDGTQIASSMGTTAGGLWSGTLLARPNQLLDGSAADREVWTGASQSGLNAGNSVLGRNPFLAFGNVAYGSSDWFSSLWIATSLADKLQVRSMYGISEELVVPGNVSPVPEPAAFAVFLCGIVVGTSRNFRRRRC